VAAPPALDIDPFDEEFLRAPESFRLEGELLLAALARQVTSLELAGPVRPYLNNTIKGLAGLPVRVAAA
jgi:hypothetical protein